MGFDNECIINIQSLAGEYFCPVCRTLVYPNEALQSQCTHLYCKPCLAYVVGTTKACPYDGYLVTEADSKPLTESNKGLAETIGKILVHCLFHRSGCTWQGPLSDCTSHCAGCAFGNSPVICNRCGIQIVHRQVQEHAQNCSGANHQVQQTTESSKDAAASGAAASANPSQTITQPGGPTSQAQLSQTTAAPPDSNQQANANLQVQAVAPAAVTTTEQWYQQQFQQYYQQYPGYDPYQQSYQQYYPYQQQTTQQLQQNPPYVQGQHQPQVYAQPQTAVQPQHQPQLQPQVQGQPQTQPQMQLQPQPQAQQQPQSQLQMQPQGQPQSHPYVQNQGNPQQQPHPVMQPHPQPPQLQTQPPAHGLMLPQQQPYPQAQPHLQSHSMQPHPQQNLQAPQYQQTHSQGQQAQLQIQQPHPQSHLQPQPHPQPPSQMQPQNHPQLLPQQPNNPQSQQPASHAVSGHTSYPPVQPHQQQMIPGAPQAHPMHMHPPSGSLPPAQVHAHFPQQSLQMRPPQAHTLMPNQQQPSFLQSQGQHPSITPAQQHQIRPSTQQGHLGHQRPVIQPVQQPLQQYGQQQPYPVQASGPIQGQLQQQVPFAQQPMHSQARPQGPVALPPPPPHSGVQAHGMLPHQSQTYAGRPVAPNHAALAQSFTQSPGAFGVAAHPRPMQLGSVQPSGHQIYGQHQVPSEQQFSQSGLASKQTFMEGNGAVREAGSPSQKTTGNDATGFGGESVGVKALKTETGEKFIDEEHKTISEGENNGTQDEILEKDADAQVDAVNDGSREPSIKKSVKEEGTNGNLNPSSGYKSVGIATLDEKDDTAVVTKQVELSSVEDSSLHQTEARAGHKKDAMNASSEENILNQGQLTPQGPAVDEIGGFQGKGVVNASHRFSLTDQGREPYGPSSQQQRPDVPSMLQSGPFPGPPGQGLSQLRPQGLGHGPPPRRSLNAPNHFQQSCSFGQFGHPRGSYELQPGVPQGQYYQSNLPHSQAGLLRTSKGEPAGGPPLGVGPPGSFDQQDGLMGRAPHGLDGPHHPNNPIETEMFQNRRPRHFEGRYPGPHLSGPSKGGQSGQPSANELNLPRMNGVPGLDKTSAPGLHDEGFKDDRRNTFPIGPTRRLDQGEFEEAPKQFPKPSHTGTEPSPLKFLPPYHPGGAFHSNDDGERLQPMGFHENNRGRGDFAHTQPDLNSGPGFGQHQMDRLTPRSPGREYLGVPSHGFGGPSSGPRIRSGIDDIDGRNPVGNSFRDGRFPVLPLQRGEFDGPGNFGMGEHFRDGSMMGKDFMPNRLLRGELFGPRNATSGFGDPRMGEVVGPGGFPLSEPFRGNKSNHPRLGEPGFRSSYSLNGFPTDGGFYTGNLDSFDRFRKRMPTSMGWCRICKADCETLEGLDVHSQTREHQKMTMDMVISIKQQNAKRQKTSKDHSSIEEGSRSRNSGNRGRGKKA